MRWWSSGIFGTEKGKAGAGKMEGAYKYHFQNQNALQPCHMLLACVGQFVQQPIPLLTQHISAAAPPLSLPYTLIPLHRSPAAGLCPTACAAAIP